MKLKFAIPKYLAKTGKKLTSFMSTSYGVHTKDMMDITASTRLDTSAK